MGLNKGGQGVKLNEEGMGQVQEAETRQPANLRNPAALCAWREACVKQMF